MALPTFTANTAALAEDVTDIVSHLQGASGKTDAWHFRVSTSNNFLITLSDAAGARKFSIRDSALAEVFAVDSDGNLTISGGFATGTFTFPTSATPTQTTEGQAAWDTDDDVLTVGTGAATKRLGLTRGAGSNATATAEIVYDTTNAQLKVWDGSASQSIGYKTTTKYSTATQTFTTNTTFADVITSGAGTASFAIGANEVWHVEFQSGISYGGTGGVKIQLTGPAAPTAVNLWATYPTNTEQTSDGTESQYDVYSMNQAIIAAFSSAGVAFSSAAPIQSGTSQTDRGIRNGMVRISGIIANGANPGTVTFQAAQNSSNSTTVLGVGTFIRAEKIS